ncbi:MAG: response regulator transcription factor [Bacteroidia bacterium]|nr:response regulator transcription factor [Bacteroidia bacterium]
MSENKIKILLAEDDMNFGSVLKSFLELNKYEVVLCEDGNVAWSSFKNGQFDICILDVMMPYKDGFTLGKEIREVDSQIPMIFLTAKSMKEDVMQGYQVGADDYLTKPFDSEVLLLKIKAILNRRNSNNRSQNIYEVGSFSFDPALRKIQHQDVEYRLSPKESDLLQLLCDCKETVLPRSEALIKIWKEDNYFTARSMDVYIAKLRKYLKDDPNVEIINMPRKGFRLTVHPS